MSVSVTQLVPKAADEIEQVIASPWGLHEMVKWLKSKGVEWTEPDPPLTLEETRTILRVIYRELRMRENSP